MTAKLLFIPVGLASGALAGLAARKLFETAWSGISDGEPPEPDQRDASWPALAAALALEGATSRLASGLAEHGARASFLRATGRWPGEEEDEGSQGGAT